MNLAEAACREAEIPFETMLNIYDKSIIDVESLVDPDETVAFQMRNGLTRSLASVEGWASIGTRRSRPSERSSRSSWRRRTWWEQATAVRLPFPKEHIRSEILCHGLGPT